MTTTNKAGQTRRSFLAACGVGAAALAAPAGASAAAGVGPAAHLPALLAWYQGELERFLADVEAELRAGTMGDVVEKAPGKVDALPDFVASDRLEEAVAERFGLQVAETPDEQDGGVWIEGDNAAAHLILAVSPSAEELGDGGWSHVAHWANETVVTDVLKAARARGWIRRAA